MLKAYEEARTYSLANPAELKKTLVAYTKLPEPVIERQLERTELTHSTIGQPQIDTILAAGLALQQAGVITAEHRRAGRRRRPHRPPLRHRVALDRLHRGRAP